MRRLQDATPLMEWADFVKAQPFESVSYRHLDGTQKAFALVRERMAAGKTVFWERWALPRRLAVRRDEVDAEALNQRLLGMLGQSQRVWGIESASYGVAGSYSAREKEFACRLGLYKSAPVQIVKPTPDPPAGL